MKAFNLRNRSDEEKKALMIFGIVIFMVLILVIWCFSIKDVISSDKNNQANKETTNWQGIKDQFSQTMGDIGAKLDRLSEKNKDFGAASSTGISNESRFKILIDSLGNQISSSSSSTLATITIEATTSEDILKIKNKIKDLENKLEQNKK